MLFIFTSLSPNMLSYVVVMNLGPFISDIFLFELLFSFYVFSVILIFLLSVYI